jgi:periplasmic divalent cation tolerance protein
VEAKLAACVNVLPRIASHYRWQGKIERASESLLVCKTRAALLRKLEAFVVKNHPYDVPEIIALPVVFGRKAYLDWLAE